MHLRSRSNAPLSQIIARFRPRRLFQLSRKKIRREVEDLVQAGPLLLLRFGLRRDARQRQARLAGEALNRFGESQPLGFHDEVEDVAVFAGRQVEPGHLLVVDEKRRRPFRVERREPLPFAARFHEFDAPPRHFRDRKPGFDVVEERRREAHPTVVADNLEAGPTVLTLSP